ncbi:MAG: hypothetical protein WKG01_21130 [Kofleriaceae bacterium]
MTRNSLFIVCLLLATYQVAAAEPRPLVVVVAKSSLITNVSKLDLKRSFLGDAIVVGDVRLAPFNAEPNSDERAGFDLAVLGMATDQTGRFWVDRKVRGQGTAPRAIPAMHLMKVVAKFPGAISYVRGDQLTADVRPVKVDGLAHTDPHYSIVTR